MTDGAPGRTWAGWERVSPEHAIFGTLSRKTELMENCPLQTVGPPPYHLPWGPQKTEGAEWGGGGPKYRFGDYPLTVQLPEQAWWLRAGWVGSATTPIYTLAQPPPPRGGPRGPSSKIPSGRGLDCTTLWSCGREGGPRSHLDLGFPTTEGWRGAEKRQDEGLQALGTGYYRREPMVTGTRWYGGSEVQGQCEDRGSPKS